MKTVVGNLIQMAIKGEFDVICHGANCRNTMGSGIAASIKYHFPEAYMIDSLAFDIQTNCIKTGKTSSLAAALGNISFCPITRGLGKIQFWVVNAYSQQNFGPPPTVYADYTAIRKCFQKINKIFSSKECRIGYCKIGCGLGGADWNTVEKIIDEELFGRDHTLVVLE